MEDVLMVIIIILLFFAIGAAVIDAANPGEVCLERNFGAEVWLPDETGQRTVGKGYYCVRLIEGTPEAKPLEWVKENCGNNGECVDEAR